jgi:uncharacterized protein
LTAIVDTGAVFALMREDDPHHIAARDWFSVADEDLVTTPLAVAEMDHLVTRWGGPDAAAALRSDFDRGAYSVRWWADALAETIAIAGHHPHIGLTDASLVALAGRLRTSRIATFDHRRFRALTTPQGVPFTVLPADAH